MISLLVGESIDLRSVPRNSAARALTGKTTTFQSSNSAIIAVTSTGQATGVGAGSCTITATCEGLTATISATVTAIAVASLDVAPLAPSIPNPGTQQLTATPRDASGNALTGRSIAYSSSNTAVATVSVSGLCTAVAPGRCTITVSCEGKVAAVDFRVQTDVASVLVTPNPATVTEIGTVQLAAVAKDALGNTLTGRTFTWSSAAPSTATVDGTGLVAGQAPGTAGISAHCEGVDSAADVVTVTAVDDVLRLCTTLGDNGTGNVVRRINDVRGGVTVVSGAVSQWDDYRGASGFAQSLVQATAGSRPAWDAVNLLVQTDGIGKLLATASYLTDYELSTNPTTVIVIGEYGTVASAGQNPILAGYIGYDNNSAFALGAANAGNIKAVRGIGSLASDLGVAAANGTRRMASISKTADSGGNASYVQRVNDHAAVSLSTTGVGPEVNGYSFNVGGTSFYGYTAGKIRAIIVLKRAMTTSDESAIKAWAQAHHGVTLAA